MKPRKRIIVVAGEWYGAVAIFSIRADSFDPDTGRGTLPSGTEFLVISSETQHRLPLTGPKYDGYYLFGNPPRALIMRVRQRCVNPISISGRISSL